MQTQQQKTETETEQNEQLAINFHNDAFNMMILARQKTKETENQLNLILQAEKICNTLHPAGNHFVRILRAKAEQNDAQTRNELDFWTKIYEISTDGDFITPLDALANKLTKNLT